MKNSRFAFLSCFTTLLFVLVSVSFSSAESISSCDNASFVVGLYMEDVDGSMGDGFLDFGSVVSGGDHFNTFKELVKNRIGNKYKVKPCHLKGASEPEFFLTFVVKRLSYPDSTKINEALKFSVQYRYGEAVKKIEGDGEEIIEVPDPFYGGVAECSVQSPWVDVSIGLHKRIITIYWSPLQFIKDFYIISKGRNFTGDDFEVSNLTDRELKGYINMFRLNEFSPSKIPSHLHWLFDNSSGKDRYDQVFPDTSFLLDKVVEIYPDILMDVISLCNDSDNIKLFEIDDIRGAVVDSKIESEMDIFR